MSIPRRFTLRLSASLLAVLVTGLAQAETGDLAGVVLGPSGAALPGAQVTVRSAAGNTSEVVVSGQGGDFRLVGLEPDSYEVETELPGFLGRKVPAVTVTGGRTTRIEVVMASATFAGSVEVAAAGRLDSLEANELRESGAADVGEALAHMPGVWKVRKGGIANDVVLRGFREDDVAVVVDGARVAGACPNRMDPPAFHLDFAEVERVEVGANGGQMAVQGALGGLVSVVTGQPSPGFHADASLVGGSFGRLNPSASASYRGERAAFLVGGSDRSSEPYRDGSGRRMTELANYSEAVEGQDAYQVATGWGRFYFQPGEAHELHLSYSHQEANDLLYPGLRMDAVYDDTDRLVLGYRYSPRMRWLRSLDATAYATKVDHWMEDSLRLTGAGTPRGWSMGTMAGTQVTGATMTADVASLVLGLEAYRREWDAWTEMAGMGYARQFSIPNVDMDVVGLSARWGHDLGARTRLELGGRVDRIRSVADPTLANTNLYFAYHDTRSVERTSTDPSWTVHLTHDLGQNLSLSAEVARTVRPPDPRELYFALKRQGSDWVGNPELETPRDTRASLGATWDLGSASVTFSGWYDRVADYITVYGQPRVNAVPGVMNSTARSWANVDAEIWGGTLQATAALGPRLYLAGSLAAVRGTKDPDPALGLTSTSLSEMPPLTGRLALRWQNARLLGEVETVAADSQDRVDSDLEETPTPGWAVVNLRGGFSLGRWRVQLLLENLLDRTYREHFSYQRDPFRSGFLLNEPGRSVTVTLGWEM